MWRDLLRNFFRALTAGVAEPFVQLSARVCFAQFAPWFALAVRIAIIVKVSESGRSVAFRKEERKHIVGLRNEARPRATCAVSVVSK